MTTSTSKLIQTVEKSTTSPLSKGQKLFNKLIKKIDAQRTQLQELQTAISLYQIKHSGEYFPLNKEFCQYQADFVFLLDGQYENKIFSKIDRQKLSDLITTIAGELLVKNEAPPQLKEIFNRYSDVDFDTQSEEAKADIKDMFNGMFGVDLEPDVDIDINDPQSVIKLMAEQMQQMLEREEEFQQNKNTNRKKTPKQLAKEAKIEQEEKDVSQSIRLIYRKLASTLHPDRELDPEEQARKTSLMQRVNVAYENRNLLQLLELQLEIEQIDETMVSTLSADRLKHYNQILSEQLYELEMEIEQTGLLFQLRFKMADKTKLIPKRLIPDLKQEIVEIKQDIEAIKLELHEFTDPKAIKTMLKNYRISTPRLPEFGLFDDAYF